MKLPHPIFLSLLAAALPAAGLASGAAEPGGIAASDLSFLAYLAGGVVGVVAVVAWVDHRVDKRVTAQAEADAATREAEYQSLLTALRHLEERLVDAEVLPAMSVSGAWRLSRQDRGGEG